MKTILNKTCFSLNFCIMIIFGYVCFNCYLFVKKYSIAVDLGWVKKVPLAQKKSKLAGYWYHSVHKIKCKLYS